MRRPRKLAHLVALACAFGIGCGDTSQPGLAYGKPVNVVWIVLDALRADHLSSYGYDRPTSPEIDALAERGVVLESAWSQAPTTLLSVPSYMTGRYEPVFYQDARHMDLWFLRRPLPEERLVSSIFRENGYATAMFSASPWYSADSRLARSFETFAPLAHGEGLDPRERATNEPLFQWISAHADAPFFLYVHSLDTHEPRYASNTDPRWLAPDYPPARDAALRRGWQRARPPFSDHDRAQIRGLYDGGIRVADAFVGEIVGVLRELGLEARTLVVISSDHGELLGEDGETMGHPAREHVDELLHVPVIFAGPGVPQGRRVASITQNADIVPTLIDLVGLETAARFQGKSLREAFGDTSVSPHEYAYARFERPFALTDPNRVLVHPDRKYEVREVDDPSAGTLQVRTFARPDRSGARRALDEAPARLELVRIEVRAVLRPLRDLVFARPPDVPPVFEIGHSTRHLSQQVVRDRLHKHDGLWSDFRLGADPQRKAAGVPFVGDRALAGFPATERLPELRLSLEIPNGRYHVSASSRFVSAVSFRFRAESDEAWREVAIEGAEASTASSSWVRLGTYEIDDQRFDYEIAAGDPSRPAVISRLLFEREGADPFPLPSELERRAEQQRLRSLGYLE